MRAQVIIMLDVKMEKGAWYVLMTKGKGVYRGKFKGREKIENSFNIILQYVFENAKMFHKPTGDWCKSDYKLTIEVRKIKGLRKVAGKNSGVPVAVWLC